MSMPHFTPGDDPGPSLPNLLKRVGLDPYPRAEGQGKIDVPHATTCVAVRYGDGVVMAGDRRATAGNLISHRTMEKVLPADRYSGVAIAGAAGPAMEMVKLFQLQLEHYEKVEGVTLSLEGKANQLSAMVRGNLPAAMQGMVVVPIFAGYDTKRRVGRLFDYDVTGGRYEERDHVATGSGSLHAGTVIKVGYREGLEPRRGRRPVRAGAVGGGRQRLRHRRTRPAAGHLPGGRHHRRAGLRAGLRRRAGRALRPHRGRSAEERQP